MGLSYIFDHARRIVRARGSGVLRAADLSEYYGRLQADPSFDPRYRSLGDLREVERIDISANELAVSASLPVYARGTKRALVATRDSVFGMLRAYASYNARMGQTMWVFRDVEAAEAWLEQEGDGPPGAR
jgi:hypothetical protein